MYPAALKNVTSEGTGGAGENAIRGFARPAKVCVDPLSRK
jgi:hypothetical protein